MVQTVLTIALVLLAAGLVARVALTRRPAASRPHVRDSATDQIQVRVRQSADSVCEKAKGLGLGDVLAEMKKDEEAAKDDVRGSATVRSIRRNVEKMEQGL